MFLDNNLVSMYRKKENREYYTFPGGGLNDGETEIECVIREVFEEFGMNVEPVRKIYVYEDERSIQHFYLCNWVSGEFGTGDGEEFQDNRNFGVYIPSKLDINILNQYPLMPPIVAKQLMDDISKYGTKLTKNVLFLTEK